MPAIALEHAKLAESDAPAALLAAIALDSGWMLAVVLVALAAIPTVAIGWTFDHRGSLQNALSTAAMGTGALMSRSETLFG